MRVCGSCIHWMSDQPGYAAHHGVGLAPCDVRPVGSFTGNRGTCDKWQVALKPKPQLEQGVINAAPKRRAMRKPQDVF